VRTPIRKTREGWLPSQFDIGHDLCFVIHDALAQILVSGEQQEIFSSRFKFRDAEDRAAFERAADVLEWLEESRREAERDEFLVKTIFPAVLSDALHFLYEALECSRKAKLNVTYALLRKPLQESLFIFESAFISRHDFLTRFTSEPLRLRAQKVGGQDVHAKRTALVLAALGLERRFSAEYLAQLLFQKTEDGFDGICNHALHLFTEHAAIRTEPMNMNFIFSGWEEKLTQWGFLYSRLPYLLAYAYKVVEAVCSSFAPTHPSYLSDIDRRISALVVQWWEAVGDEYRNDALRVFASGTQRWLDDHCKAAGYRAPSPGDLDVMARTGRFPGESWFGEKRRHWNWSRTGKR